MESGISNSDSCEKKPADLKASLKALAPLAHEVIPLRDTRRPRRSAGSVSVAIPIMMITGVILKAGRRATSIPFREAIHRPSIHQTREQYSPLRRYYCTQVLDKSVAKGLWR